MTDIRITPTCPDRLNRAPKFPPMAECADCSAALLQCQCERIPAGDTGEQCCQRTTAGDGMRWPLRHGNKRRRYVGSAYRPGFHKSPRDHISRREARPGPARPFRRVLSLRLAPQTERHQMKPFPGDPGHPGHPGLAGGVGRSVLASPAQRTPYPTPPTTANSTNYCQ